MVSRRKIPTPPPPGKETGSLIPWPVTVDVNIAWRCISTPPYAFMAWCLVKEKVKVKLYLCLTKHHAMKAYWGVAV
jgi:hypothetical protein